MQLKEAKEKFDELYRKGDAAGAGEIAKTLMREFPDSPRGYYYALVLETKNFRVAGDREKTAKLYEAFAARAEKSVAKKYGDLLAGLNLRAQKQESVAVQAKKEKKKITPVGALLVALCVLFAAASILSFGSFRTFSEPYTAYQTVKWEEDMFDTVVYKLTLNKENGEITDGCLVDGIWLNLGGIDRSAGSNVSVAVSSATSSTGSFSTGFGGGTKTVANTFDSVGKWIRLVQSTSTSTTSPRIYYQLSTKSELKYNEVMFLDRNGRKIAAEIFCAGPNAKTNEALGKLITSDLYRDRAEAAKVTLDEQEKFDLSAVNGGSYRTEDYTGKLTEKESAVLDSVRNLLSGENGYTEPTSNAFGLQLIAVGVAIFGGNTFGLRFMPTLFALGTIVLLYFFAKRLFSSQWAGFAAAFLFAVGGYALSAATLGTTDMIFAFFALLSVYFMTLFYQNARKRNQRSYVYLALSGAAYGLTVSIKTQGVFLLLALVAVFILALVAQHNAGKDGAKGEDTASAIARSRNLYVGTFLLTFILLPVIWIALTFLFSYHVYFVEAGLSAGAFFRRFFAAPFTEISTQYAAHNKTNILGWLIGYQAEKLSASKYFFGNTVLSLLALFSFLYSTVYVVYAFLSKSEYKTAAFRKQVAFPYAVLTAAFVSTWVFSAFSSQQFASGFMLPSVFYYAFIVLAARLFVTQETKVISVNGEKAGVSTLLFAIVIAFALVLGVFAYAKYAGIALDSYPLDLAAIRW